MLKLIKVESNYEYEIINVCQGCGDYFYFDDMLKRGVVWLPCNEVMHISCMQAAVRKEYTK